MKEDGTADFRFATITAAEGGRLIATRGDDDGTTALDESEPAVGGRDERGDGLCGGRRDGGIWR